VSELVRPDPNPSVVRPAIVYFALFGALGAYFPYIAVFFGSIGLSLPEIGLLSALNAGIAVVAAPTWGAIVDRARDIRAPIVVAGAWSALAAVWLGLSREPAMVAFALRAAWPDWGPCSTLGRSRSSIPIETAMAAPALGDRWRSRSRPLVSGS
jgi:predicted MFS family arabinose efflux permease